MANHAQPLPSTLIDLLNTSLLLQQLAPYLAIGSLLSLSRTCKAARAAVHSAEAFRYLDLSTTKATTVPGFPIDVGGTNWRAERMDESVTEDEFYAGPLRGIFYSKLSRLNALSHVRTMILDGLSVTAELVQEIISDQRFNVKLLSLRHVRHLNHRILRQVLDYVVRPSRPDGTPKLKALYIFGPKDFPVQDLSSQSPGCRSSPQSFGVLSSEGAQIGTSWNGKSFHSLTNSLTRCKDRWYHPRGRLLNLEINMEWAQTISKCEGVIAFDAVNCRGPGHSTGREYRDDENSMVSHYGSMPAVANIALGIGCHSCGSCTEKPPVWGKSPPHHLPLLSPPPLHSSSVREAQRPILTGGTEYPQLFARCYECLKGRWCQRCFKWWCEECYPDHMVGSRTDEVSSKIKVHMGLCAESCLREEMMVGAGSNGMWG